jgi:M6 family metalloprotease-like protein
MFKPTFDVVGIVTLSNKYSYYGQNSGGNDMRVDSLAPHAIAAAVSQLGTDFSQYVRTTTNVNGTTTGVPLVCIFYAGYGEATGSPSGSVSNTVWPCEWDCDEDYSGTHFNAWFVGNELYSDGSLMGMGVFCHEAGHALGLPDFYCTNYNYSNDDSFSNWSIMDCGAYVNDARAPIGYTAYERSYLGWLDIPTYTAGEYQNLDPYTNDNGTTAVKIATNSSTEYFILENRQPGTWYPEDMGSGLFVSRFAYNQTAWDNNTLNNTKNKKRAKIVTANGATLNYSGDQANLYGNGVNSITSLALYSSGTVNPQITTITKNADGTITLNAAAAINVAKPTFSPAAGRYTEAQTVTISCATEGATIYYTIDGSTPTASSTRYTSPITIGETTTLKAIAVNADGEESLVATAKYIIGAISDTKNFKRVTSTDELVSGMRYIIACGSKKVAAGELTTTSSASYLSPVDVSLSNDIITITDDVTVFTLDGSGTKFSFLNDETGEYLYATEVKKVNYSSTNELWTLANGANGVEMIFDSYGTMTYNVSSPRFTTYISDATAAMIRANLYMEYDGEVPIEKQDVTMNFSSTSVTATLGKTFTPPTLTTVPADLPVTYASGNTDLATVDPSTGAVTLVAKGTTTITASFAGNDYYNPDSASYTLTVQGPTTATNRYELVTDASTLAVGDSILIVYGKGTYRRILSTTQNKNNREASEFVFNGDNTITPDNKAARIVLGGEKGKWTLYVTNGESQGYLYASGSNKSNYLQTHSTIDSYSQASISIDTDGSAAIVFQGTNTNRWMRFNSTTQTPIFGCYKSSSSIDKIPQIYRQIKQEISSGDVNKDGDVSIADITALVNILMGQDAEQVLYDHKAADADGNGSVEAADVETLLNLILAK